MNDLDQLSRQHPTLLTSIPHTQPSPQQALPSSSPCPSPTTTSIFAPRPQAPPPAAAAAFRPTGAKRSFSQSLSPPSASSSDDDDEAADPPLKRRYLSPPQPFAIPPNTQPGAPVYQPYYTSHSSGVGVKRGADDLGVDDDGDDDGSSTEGEGAASSSSNATHDGFAPSSRPPPVKRMRRGLSSHLKRMGLNPADVGPTIEEHPTASPFAPAAPAWNPYAHPEVQASSVVEPGEIGPAVWLGPSRSGVGDEVRFEELSDSDSGELEDEKTKAWRLELWKGHDTSTAPPPTRGRDRAEMRLPSYMSSSSPWAYNLEPPQDVWTNRERGLVLYKPQPPTSASSPATLSSPQSADMELDSPAAERPPTANPLADLNAGGWFSDASRFEELQEDGAAAAAAAAAAPDEGGMDVD